MKTLVSVALIVILCGSSAWTQAVRAETWEEFQRNKASGEQGTGLVAKKSKFIPKGVILEKLRKDRQVVFESDSVQFSYGSAVVQEASQAQLAEIAAALTESADFRDLPFVYVDGHCCNIGSDENNCRLSYERARAVIAALVGSSDIAESKFRARGFGERTPAVSNDTEEERSRNRRVVIKSQEAPGATDESQICSDGQSNAGDTVPANAPNSPIPGTATGVPAGTTPGGTEVYPDVETRGGAPKSPGFLPPRKPTGSKRLQSDGEKGATPQVKPAGPGADRSAPRQDPNLPEGFIKSTRPQ